MSIDEKDSGKNLLSKVSASRSSSIRKFARGRSAKSYFGDSDVAPKKKVKKIAAKKKVSSKTGTRKKQTLSSRSVKVTRKTKRSVPIDELLEHDALPGTYAHTFVTLVPKDPYRLYAYWEICAEDVERAKKDLGSAFNGAVYTLRVYDITLIDFDGTNANGWFDLDELFMEGRDIKVWSDQASYCVEIGMRRQDGGFCAFARSNVAATPRGNVSNRCDLMWKEVSDDSNDEGAFFNFDLLDRTLRKKLPPRANWQLNTSRYTLSSDQIRLYYQLRRGLRQQLAASSQENSFLKEIKDDECVVRIERSFNPGLMTQTYVVNNNVSSPEFASRVSSAEFVRVKEIKEKREEKDFYFEMNMELTVRGKTEPGAECFMDGKKINMNDDGTFTLKMSLEDGVLPFNCEARSLKKQLAKRIETSVIRTPTKKIG